MLHPILADASSSEKVLIWTLVTTNVIQFLVIVVKAIVDQVNRVQDRLDAESKARIILQEGKAREERLAAKIDENTEVSKAAFREANGVNAKLERHSNDVKIATEVIAEATKVVAAQVEGKGE